MMRQDVLSIIERETGWSGQESMHLDDLGMDSLETLSLLTSLDIPYSALPDIHTVDDVIRYAETH